MTRAYLMKAATGAAYIRRHRAGGIKPTAAAVGVGHGTIRRALAGRPLQMAKRLRIERWLAAIALLACSSPDVGSELATERTVFSAPDEIHWQARKAAADWSWLTGVDVTVDNDNPFAIRIELVSASQIREHRDAELAGFARRAVDRDGAFVGCYIEVADDLSESKTLSTIAHEMGHCLAASEEHVAEDGCVMSRASENNWCDSDVKHMCSHIDCQRKEDTQ